MKVLFQSRLDILTNMGGDSVQMIKTKEELEKLGVEVDINSDYKADLTNYDLVHVFGLQWLCEPYVQYKNAKKQNKVVVLSPIHHSETEVARYEKLLRYSFRRIVNVFIWSQQYRDLLKNLFRSFFDLRRLYPVLLAAVQGYRNQQRKVLLGADRVLVQTDQEGHDLNRDFGVKVGYEKIKLGVGDVFIQDTTAVVNQSGVLTVGRIEPRKNQLKLIKAIEAARLETGLDLTLTVIGGYNKNNKGYYKLFMDELKTKTWVKYIQKVEYEQMPSYYKQAKVCVSASWFETTGLSLIEAAICGCNVVAPDFDTGARIKEYLGDIPYFCDPNDVSSIKEAVVAAYTGKVRQIPGHLVEELTWGRMAQDILTVYNGLVK